MGDFEASIQQAVDTKEIPGCVLLSTDRDDSFAYSRTFGTTSMKSENAQPLQLDTVMWVASCTKLMTSICALQLVERGHLTLDDPVYTHIPELQALKILHSFDDAGTPIETPHTKPITLRTLLTHTSGLTYTSLHPKLLAWLAYHDRQPGAGAKLLQRYDAPLTFEPGEGWMYGPGIDYAGLLVERVTGLSLEAYMRQNLWEPLGITDMTFRLSVRPDMRARMADMSFREGGSAEVRYTAERQGYLDVDGGEMQDCLGGDGVFTSAGEYIKVLKAVLTMDEDGKLLKRDMVEELFTPQLGEKASAAMNAMLQVDMVNNAMGGTQMDQKKDWGLGGLLLLHDQVDGKKAGTMIWGGLPNLTWWVDRKTGLCGLYAGQVMPTGDAKCSALARQFEAAMYKNYQSSLAGPRS